MQLSRFFLTKLRFRLFASFGALILLASIGGLLSVQLMHAVRDYQEAALQTGSMVRWLSEARKQEKNFILTDRKLEAFYLNQPIQSLQKHQQALKEIRILCQSLGQSEVIKNLGLQQELQSAAIQLNMYEESFQELTKAYQLRGFKDHGLEGEMRTLVHALQAGQTSEEQLFALTLRKHEKDFFLRADEKYIDKLNALADEYIAFLNSDAFSVTDEAYRLQNSQAVNAYRKQFNQIAAIERKIGLTPAEGLLGALAQQAATLEPLFGTIQGRLVAAAKEVSQQARMTMLVSALGLLLVGSLIAFMLARRIANPIVLLTTVIAQVKRGDFAATEKLKVVNRRDEIGSLVENFRQLVNALQQQMKQVSEQKYQLEQAAHKEAGRNRLNEAQARFERMMASRSEGLAAMTDRLLAELVSFLNLQQGAVYVLQQEEGQEACMEMMSCYAYKRKKYIGAKVMLGEGLIGGCWQEGDAMYITDLPEEYGNIGSGLGQSKPKSLFICPVATDQGIEGVIELAGLHTISEEQREFIQQVGKSLAATIGAYRMQEQTESLLAKSKQLTITLQENEEELRQNMEEMQASQEELQSQRTALQKELAEASLLLDLHQRAVQKHYPWGLIVQHQTVEFLNEDSKRLLGAEQVRDQLNHLLAGDEAATKLRIGSISYACEICRLNEQTALLLLKKASTQAVLTA